MEKKKTKKAFLQGAIPAEMIARSIEQHSHKTAIGAHQLFLGQVRADELETGTVTAIEYSAHEEMAEKLIHEIREKAFELYDITCLHVYHSLGKVSTGALCFFVFVSSPHRKAANEACQFLVEEIKSKVPIFGKEITSEGKYQWKTNR